ncbi:MAG: hypothetical protein K2O24_08710 [Muribaculaceae bacterium]|nr:hypothetical protein [Muribaculaceae bacterium]
MKKTFLMTLALILGTMLGFAQDEPKGKLNVFFDYFDRPGSVSFIWAETIRNNVMEGIQKTNRVNLIDVDSRGTLAIERSRREQDNVSAGEDLDRLKVMTEEGANLLVKGIVTDVTSKESVGSKGESLGYEAAVAFTLKVIDPANGTTIHTKSFKFPKNFLTDLTSTLTQRTAKSADEAVQNVAKTMGKEMRIFVEEAFPSVGKIVELDEVKGNDAKTAYINLGSDNGMSKGAKFEVRVKRMIAGSTSYKMLGEAEVVDVESGDLSKIKIKKGGKEIGEAFKAGQDLVVKSTR